MQYLWLGAGAFLLAASAVQAAPTGRQQTGKKAVDASPVSLLSQASNAARTTNYEGTLVYRSGPAVEVLRVVHRYKNGEQSEHIITQTGVPRELIRKGNALMCVLPEDHRLQLHHPQVKQLLGRLHGPSELARLGRWYQFVSVQADRIAGRKCAGIAVNPKDHYRYGYRVWFDDATGLPLRVALVNDGDQVLEQVMFTQIAFPASIPDSAFAPEFKGAKGYQVVRHTLPASRHSRVAHGASGPAAASGKNKGVAEWHVTDMPPGFVVTRRGQRDMPDQLGMVDHMLLSDGLSSVSIFAARLGPGMAGLEGMSRMGAVHAYGRMLDGYHITVVGEAPARTVRMIGNAVQPAQAANASSAAPSRKSTVPAH